MTRSSTMPARRPSVLDNWVLRFTDDAFYAKPVRRLMTFTEDAFYGIAKLARKPSILDIQGWRSFHRRCVL